MIKVVALFMEAATIRLARRFRLAEAARIRNKNQ